jgi:pilus assembly protein CpaF
MQANSTTLTVFSIIISEKGGAERRQSFNQREVSIGRVQGNDLVLPKGNVSKRHCRIEWVDGRFLVSDQNSTNGTYLNRRRISQSTVVRQGDRIYLGDYVLRIEEGVGDELGEASEALQGPSVVPVSESGLTTGQSVAAVQPPAGVHPAQAARVPPPSAQVSPDHAPTAQLPPSQFAAGPPTPQYRSAPPQLSLEASPGFAAAGPALLGTIPAPVLPPRPDDRGLHPEPFRSPHHTDADDTSGSAQATVRFIVERIAQVVSRQELDNPAMSARVEGLIEEHLAELQQQGLAVDANSDLFRRAARTELLELGPLGALLEDPAVSEIAASGVGYVSMVRGAERRQLAMPFCAPGSLDRALERLCSQHNVPLHPNEQMGQRNLVSASFTLEFVRGPSVPAGPIVRLRRRDQVSAGLDDLVRGGVVSRTIATFLHHCVTARANILVIGQQRTGASELLAALGAAAEGDRVLVLADVDELSDPHGRTLALQETPGLRLDAVLSRLVGIPGHRLVIDGLSQGTRALATLRSLFEGADGVVARLHARSIERGLAQLCSQVAVSNPGLAASAVADGIVAAFDIAIEVGRLRDGRSRVLRVAELSRGDTLPVVANDIFNFQVERIASGGTVEGTFNPTGRRPHFALDLKSRGIRMDSGIFGRAARGLSPDTTK